MPNLRDISARFIWRGRIEDGERERRILSKPFENGETKSMGRGRQGEKKTEGIKIYLP